MKLGSIALQAVMAVVIGFLGGKYGPWLGLASFLPTVVGMAQRMLAPEEASGWHYEKRVAIDQLIARLDDGQSAQEVWREYLELDGAMAKTFPHGSWT